MNKHRGRVVLIVLAGSIAAVFAQRYRGRIDLQQSSYRGCLRATADRTVNALGWRTAEAAREASAAHGGPNVVTDRVAAARYARIAASLEARTAPTHEGREAFCRRAFPHPSPWPF